MKFPARATNWTLPDVTTAQLPSYGVKSSRSKGSPDGLSFEIKPLRLLRTASYPPLLPFTETITFPRLNIWAAIAFSFSIISAFSPSNEAQSRSMNL